MSIARFPTGKSPHEFPEPGDRAASDADHARWLELNAVIHRACQADVRRRYPSAEAMHADVRLLLEGRSVNARQARERRWAMGRKVAASVAALGAVEGVQVGPRKSGWVVEDEEALRERVTREYGARQVITGRTHVMTNGLEVTVAVWDAAERPRWSESFLGQTNALLELERQVVQAVNREIGLQPTAAEQRGMEEILSRNVEVLKLLNQGRVSAYANTRVGLTAAAPLCYRAIELDPKCLDARRSLIWVYRNLYWYDQPARVIWPQMCDLARQALQVDDTSYGARYWLA